MLEVDPDAQGGKLIPILGWISVGCALCCSFFAVPGGLEDPFYILFLLSTLFSFCLLLFFPFLILFHSFPPIFIFEPVIFL
jgi:hypothetical protein